MIKIQLQHILLRQACQCHLDRESKILVKERNFFKIHIGLDNNIEGRYYLMVQTVIVKATWIIVIEK